MSINLAGIQVNVPLTNIVLMRTNADDTYIADKSFKSVPVPTRTGTYYEYGNNHLQLEDSTLGIRGIANKVSSTIANTGVYSVRDYALKEFLADQELSETLPAFRNILKETTAYGVANRLRIQKEIAASTTLFNSANFPGFNVALGTSQRFDNKTSDVLGLIGAACQSVKNNCGLRANTIIMGVEVWNALRTHPDLLAKTASTNLRNVTQSTLMDFLNYDNLNISNIFVGDGTYKTSKENQTDTFGQIWGKNFLVAYIDPSASTIRNLSLCKNFNLGGNSINISTFKETPEEKGLWYRAETSYDMRIIKPACGYLYTTAVN